MGKALSGELSCPCDRSCFYTSIEGYTSIKVYTGNSIQVSLQPFTAVGSFILVCKRWRNDDIADHLYVLDLLLVFDLYKLEAISRLRTYNRPFSHCYLP